MGDNIRLRIGKKIKEMRNRRGLTQARLSEVAEIDYKYIQRLEGKNPPALKVDTIARLAKALKVKPADLLKF
ncbi:MAG: helix-turn-helix transcriptional regulator [Dehalococcoidales bacterium]|jgi:transcriptional regulator with XRE-family HTH domain